MSSKWWTWLRGRSPLRKGFTQSKTRNIQSKIVELRQAGKTNAEIAEILAVKPRTVQYHIGRLLKKGAIESQQPECLRRKNDGAVRAA